MTDVDRVVMRRVYQTLRDLLAPALGEERAILEAARVADDVTVMMQADRRLRSIHLVAIEDASGLPHIFLSATPPRNVTMDWEIPLEELRRSARLTMARRYAADLACHDLGTVLEI